MFLSFSNFFSTIFMKTGSVVFVSKDVKKKTKKTKAKSNILDISLCYNFVFSLCLADQKIGIIQKGN